MKACRFFAERSFIKLLKWTASITRWENLPSVAKPLAKILWVTLPKRRAITIDNLKQALKCDGSVANELAKKVFHHVALTALEFLKMDSSPEEALAQVRVKGWDEVKAMYQQQGNLIFVTGHLGNFELMGARIAKELPLWVIARSQSQAAWQVIKGIREKVGMRVIEKPGSLKEAIKALKQGGALGILADQHAGEGPGTIVIPFLGRLASIFKTPALLAARTKSPLVFCYDVRLPDGTHESVFLPPRFVQNHEVEEVTIWFCKQLEEAILKAPEQWWWLHDRWKVARRKAEN